MIINKDALFNTQEFELVKLRIGFALNS